MKSLRIGLIINPVAGIGGAVGLKGSDGQAVLEEARARGAQPRAEQRVALFLQSLESVLTSIEWWVWQGAMGENLLRRYQCTYTLLGAPEQEQTQPQDTIQAARAMQAAGVDLILFAGGDGTARDMVNAVGDDFPVLGIPAGVKIHSGVYAVNGKGAAEIVQKLATGKIVNVAKREVRDIDEAAFRAGVVKAKYYGELLVPIEDQYLQQVKCSGAPQEEIELTEIGQYIADTMEPDTLYILGPGTTTKAVSDSLGLPATLLGIDLIFNHELIVADATEMQILDQLARCQAEQCSAKIVVTLIGGQGHIFGRGNHQLSPAVLRKVGKENIITIATRGKLQDLGGRPLLVDTWDGELNQSLAGLLPLITGYEDLVLYPVSD